MTTHKVKKIRITQIRSLIHQKPTHKKTIAALGLKRIGHTREMVDTPQLRGMISKVNHMVTWEEVQ
jgi:large subunit ribosomal protein L30